MTVEEIHANAMRRAKAIAARSTRPGLPYFDPEIEYEKGLASWLLAGHVDALLQAIDASLVELDRAAGLADQATYPHICDAMYRLRWIARFTREEPPPVEVDALSVEPEEAA